MAPKSKALSVRCARYEARISRMDAKDFPPIPKVEQGINTTIELLILDEWLLMPLSTMEARDLLEIVEARHKRASTIFISQFAPTGWHSKIGEDILADAILDRIVHDSYTIFIEGKDSMRKKKGIKTG